MSRFFVTSAALLVAGCLATSSCSKVAPTGQVENGRETGQLVSPTLRGLSFEIALPSPDATIVDPRAMIQEAEEYAIKTLWMLEVDPATKQLVSAPVDVTKETGYTNVGTKVKFTYVVKDVETKSRAGIFYFLANVPTLPTDWAVGKSLDDILKVTCEQVNAAAKYSVDPKVKEILYADAGKSYIPMTAFATQGSTSSELITVVPGGSAKVDLVRNVARVDVVNHIPGFKITKMELANAFDKSYMHNDYEKKKGTPKRPFHTPVGMARLTKPLATVATLPTAAPTDRTGQWMKKAFYLYEGSNAAASAEEITTVNITAEFNGKTKVYPVSFISKKDNKPVDIHRNFRYIIRIGDVIEDPNTKDMWLKFAIEDEAWTVHNMSEDFHIVDIQGDGYAPVAKVINKGTLTAGKDAKSYELTMTHYFTATPTYGAEIGKDSPKGMITKAEVSGDKLTITLSANETGAARKGSVVLKVNGENFIIEVTQQA